MEKPEFIVEMEEMNDKIDQLKTEMHRLLSEQEETEASIKLIEAEVMDIITDETDAAGKAKFSNADKRNAELKIRLVDATDYQELKNRYRDGKKTIQSLGLKIEHTMRNFEIYRIMGSFNK